MLPMIQIAMLILSTAVPFAHANDARLQQKVDELEKSVRSLEDKVQKMESTLMKGGGFMIVANYTCDIDTPFNGSYSSTELSEKAARQSVMDKCREKVSDATQCSATFVKCKK